MNRFACPFFFLLLSFLSLLGTASAQIASHSSLEFFSHLSYAPAAQELRIDVAPSQSWQVVPSGEWLNVSQASGTGPTTIQVYVDFTPLAPGQPEAAFNGSLTVHSGGQQQSIPVSYYKLGLVTSLSVESIQMHPALDKFYLLQTFSNLTEHEGEYIYALLELDYLNHEVLQGVWTDVPDSGGASPRKISTLALAGIDVQRGRLYLRHLRDLAPEGTVYKVLDTDTLTKAEEDLVLPDFNGAAVFGYGSRMSFGTDSGVTIYDLAERRIVLTIPAEGNEPVTAIVSADGNSVYRWYDAEPEDGAAAHLKRFSIVGGALVESGSSAGISSPGNGSFRLSRTGDWIFGKGLIFDSQSLHALKSGQSRLQDISPQQDLITYWYGSSLFGEGRLAWHGGDDIALPGDTIEPSYFSIDGSLILALGYSGFSTYKISDLSLVRNPHPVPGSQADPWTENIDWADVPGATAYHFYFGLDEDDVANATTSSAEYKGLLQESSFHAGLLPLVNTYFWRVDAVRDSGVDKGHTNRFQVSPIAVASIETGPTWTAEFVGDLAVVLNNKNLEVFSLPGSEGGTIQKVETLEVGWGIAGIASDGETLAILARTRAGAQTNGDTVFLYEDAGGFLSRTGSIRVNPTSYNHFINIVCVSGDWLLVAAERGQIMAVPYLRDRSSGEWIELPGINAQGFEVTGNDLIAYIPGSKVPSIDIRRFNFESFDWDIVQSLPVPKEETLLAVRANQDRLFIKSQNWLQEYRRVDGVWTLRDDALRSDVWELGDTFDYRESSHPADAVMIRRKNHHLAYSYIPEDDRFYAAISGDRLLTVEYPQTGASQYTTNLRLFHLEADLGATPVKFPELALEGAAPNQSYSKTIHIPGATSAHQLQINGAPSWLSLSRIDDATFLLSGTPSNADEGERWFQLSLRNGEKQLDTLTTSFRVLADGAVQPPKLLHGLGDVVAYQGMDARFEVRVEGQLLEYAWTLNGQPVSASGSVLWLRDLLMGESGLVRVTVSNPKGSVQSEATLQIPEDNSQSGSWRMTGANAQRTGFSPARLSDVNFEYEWTRTYDYRASPQAIYQGSVWTHFRSYLGDTTFERAALESDEPIWSLPGGSHDTRGSVLLTEDGSELAIVSVDGTPTLALIENGAVKTTVNQPVDLVSKWAAVGSWLIGSGRKEIYLVELTADDQLIMRDVVEAATENGTAAFVPAVSGDRVVVSTQLTGYPSPSTYELTCFQIADGALEPLWSLPIACEMPVISGNYVVVSSIGNFAVHDLIDGHKLWEFGRRIDGQPVVADNKVYAGETIMHLETGDILGSFEGLPLLATIDSLITIDRRRLLIQDWRTGEQRQLHLFKYEFSFGETSAVLAEGWLLVAHPGNAELIAFRLIPEKLFIDLPDWGQGWRHSDWMGWVYPEFFPWVSTPAHGWQYIATGGQDDSVWAYDAEIGEWLWTSRSQYPLLYLNGQGWILYNVSDEPGRWFYNYQTGAWVHDTEL